MDGGSLELALLEKIEALPMDESESKEVLLAERSAAGEGRLEVEIFLSRTLFNSFKNAAILSGGTPTVGKPCRLANGRGLMGASTGAGARLRAALAEAINREGSEVPAVGRL